jgi:large subunit ribosomal protein L3
MQVAIGKKIGMTQVESDGKFVGVSVVELLPLVITQIKKEDKDGYSAVQVGIINKKRKSKLARPQTGHLKKIKERPHVFREFRIENADDLSECKIGEILTTRDWQEGDSVTITGVSMGRGFQGMIKRHHAHRGPKTHGSDHHRAPGSIGMCSFPARVFKGKKLPGRDGAHRATIKNLSIVKALSDKKLLLLGGSIPGKQESYVGIKLSKEALKKEIS